MNEIPAAILEAERIDGGNLWQELWYLLRPMTMAPERQKLPAIYTQPVAFFIYRPLAIITPRRQAFSGVFLVRHMFLHAKQIILTGMRNRSQQLFQQGDLL